MPRREPKIVAWTEIAATAKITDTVNLRIMFSSCVFLCGAASRGRAPAQRGMRFSDTYVREIRGGRVVRERGERKQTTETRIAMFAGRPTWQCWERQR